MTLQPTKPISHYSVLPDVPRPTPHLTRVLRNATYSKFRNEPLKDRLAEATIFVAPHTNVSISEVKKSLADFFTSTLQDYFILNKGSKQPTGARLVIRINKKTQREPTSPKWHRDRVYYELDHPTQINSRYIVTILGHPTRVFAENGGIASRVGLVHSSGIRKKNIDFRKRNAAELAAQALLSLEVGKIVRMTVGREDYPVHSWPDLDLDRVFVFVQYASAKKGGA